MSGEVWSHAVPVGSDSVDPLAVYPVVHVANGVVCRWALVVLVLILLITFIRFAWLTK